MNKSQHFDLQRLAQGVYAAIAIPGGGASSNAGIIDLGERTLVFDTFETSTAAADLNSAAERLTGRMVSEVIISHAHADHWMGNQTFPQAAIIATQQTKEEMLAKGQGLLELQANPAEMEQSLREKQAQLERATDEAVRAALRASISKDGYFLEMLPRLELRYPTQTFEGKLIFHGKGRTAELLTFGKGHTPSDSFLVLPNDGIAFIGDLGFFQTQPYMADCDPQLWLSHLDALETLAFHTYVPGHGPVGTKVDLGLQRQYLLTLEGMLSQVIQQGGNVDDALTDAAA